MGQNALQIALEHHRAGRLTQAEAGYRAVLEGDSEDAGALHWLGVLTFQAGRAAEAVGLLERSVAERPDDAAVQYNLGQAYLAAGRGGEAGAGAVPARGGGGRGGGGRVPSGSATKAGLCGGAVSPGPRTQGLGRAEGGPAVIDPGAGDRAATRAGVACAGDAGRRGGKPGHCGGAV